jgi:hypothetical protein
MVSKRKVLFLQLPQLDNDATGLNENLPVAAACLEQAARQEGEGRYHEFLHLPEPLLNAGSPRLIAHISDLAPDVIACTLYLWNLEWTLRLLKALHRRLPGLQSVVGGPETAREHPLLYRAGVAQVVVVGEGETVFPKILRALRTGVAADYSTVAFKTRRGYRWGHALPDPVDLERLPPPAALFTGGPDARGMAYLEASRGCPMRCTYCRYPHLRRTRSFLSPATVEARVRDLQRLGAREIRFTDPTFNAHPDFETILQRLVKLNRPHRLSFFAEINADRLSEHQADQLAAAHFVDIEVGLQSRDPEVLRAIRRPTNLPRLEEGVRRLTRRGIKVTLDVMYGLPLQTVAEVESSVKWALRFRSVNVQCLQTLLLPGTELRTRRKVWHIRAADRPPYAVTSTGTMCEADFRNVERMIAAHPRLSSDVPTVRLVGRTLPDLFAETVTVENRELTTGGPVPGTGNRRAVCFKGGDLYGCRKAIGRFIRKAVRQEPDTLFQFVLAVDHEEPLDLLDDLIAVLRACPSHLNDRYTTVAAHGKLAARRLLIQLPGARRLSRDWINAAEDLLSGAFF